MPYLAPPEGVEPSTCRVEADCSVRLSYGGMEVTVGFEPTNNGFADRPLRPLGHVTRKFRWAGSGMTLDEVRALKRELIDELRQDQASAQRVATRWAFKYVPKEKKKSKVDRLTKLIREKTGLGRGTAEDIADAVVRGRNTDALAVQKKWPVEGGEIEGPKGTLSVQKVRDAL